MTDPIIPDGGPPIIPTIKNKMDARDAVAAENLRRGELYVPPAVVTPWAQYTRPGGSAFTSTGYQRVGGFSLAAGGHSSISFDSTGQEWTLAPGIWAVKAALRYGNSTTSGGILVLSSTSGAVGTPYPGAEMQVPNIAGLAAMSLATDIYSASPIVVDMWGYVTSATGNILDGTLSFYKIG